MNRDYITSAFRKLHGRLFSHSRRIVGDEDAADALQEAFVRLWTARMCPERESEAERILTRTVHNLTIDAYRRSQRFTAEGPPDVSDEPPRDTEMIEEVNALISRHLGERDRQILLRRDRDGWDFDEIAAEYGVTEANARMIVSRARNTIRTLYRKGDI